MASLPLMFEENIGQVAGEARFLSRGNGYALGVNGGDTVLSLRARSAKPSVEGRAFPGGRARRDHPTRLSDRVSCEAAPAPDSTSAAIRTRLVGANPRAVSIGEKRLPARISYLKGNDPKKWRVDVPAYERVRSEDVYPGIDVVYYGQQGGALEYDFIVAPGADPAGIRFAVEGADRVTLAQNGDLVLRTGAGELRQRRPVCYQERDGDRFPVEGDFVIEPAGTASAQVSFRLGSYDPDRTLVIDPVLEYSTLLGSTDGEVALGIATDGAGRAYITGVTESFDFPTLGEFQTDPGDGFFDAFVSVIDTTASGSASLLYSTYLGGSDDDEGYDIATDGAGRVFLTGHTHSTDFPTLGEFQLDPADGFSDAFVTVLDTTAAGAASLVYSTYLGGTDDDFGHGIGWVGAGKVFVTGGTFSTDYPTLNELQLDSGDAAADAYVTALDTAQTGAASLLYSTYLGGNDNDQGFGLDADSSGRAYVTGVTISDDFPTLNEFQIDPGDGLTDAFVTVLDPAQSGAASLLYSTYLGGTSSDLARNIAADGTGRAFISGFTYSIDFPTFHGFQPEHADFGNSSDAFVAAINTLDTGATSLLYSTYFGGWDDDDGFGIATDGTGRVFMSGFTASEDLVLRAQYQDFRGFSDAMVAIFDTAGDGDISLLASTYLGGPSADEAYAAATDGNGKIFVAGDSASASFPKVNQYQGYRGFFDAFVAVMDLLLPAPANLTATANSNFSIDVSWDDTTTNESGFELQRLVAGGGWVSSLLPANTNTMSDLDVLPSTTYFYRVRAVHDSAESPWSTEAAATTGPALPRAPSGLHANAQVAQELLIKWTDNSDSEDGFILQRSFNRSSWTEILNAPSNTVAFNDTGLTANTTYYYRARAYNASGFSAWSEIATGLVRPDVPIAPSGLQVNPNGNSLMLTWRDRGGTETSYRVERKTDVTAYALIATLPANTMVFTNTAVQTNTRYTYRVCAANVAGNSAFSNEASGMVIRRPLPPSALTATPLSNRIVALAWTDNSDNETEFRLERRTDASPYAQIAIIVADGTSYFDSAVAPSTTYKYRLRSANSGGASAYSNQIDAATLAGATDGVLRVRPTAIRFFGRKPGSVSEQKLTIANSGKGRLKVVVAQLAPPFEVIGARSFNLKPKEQRALKVRYTATSASKGASASLGIAGSGRKNPEVYVPVSAE